MTGARWEDPRWWYDLHPDVCSTSCGDRYHFVGTTVDGLFRVVASAGPHDAPVCGAKRISQLVRCVLPPGHDCKHLPVPQQVLDRHPFTIREIEVRRIRTTHG